MNSLTYAFERVSAYVFRFYSEGLVRIEKRVEFSATVFPDLLNLGFGDWDGCDAFDDRSVREFMAEHCGVRIYFSGSTRIRTMLYARILKTYFYELSAAYEVMAYEEGKLDLIRFKPTDAYRFDGFIISTKP